MKTPGLIAAAALAFASCQKPAAETAPPPMTPLATPAAAKPAPLAAVELPSAPAEAPALPPQPVRELAPAGVFYLRAKKSLATDDGIIGFAPGTVLRETAPGEYATNDRQALKLAAHEITNDLAEARQLAGYSAAVRAAQSQGLLQIFADEAPKTAPEPASVAPVKTMVARSARVTTQRVTTAPVVPNAPTGGLNGGAYSQKKVFHDVDRDGRAFELTPQIPPRAK